MEGFVEDYWLYRRAVPSSSHSVDGRPLTARSLIMFVCRASINYIKVVSMLQPQ
jgi:hypothetical protein